MGNIIDHINQWENDLGRQVYNGAGQVVEVALPHILNIAVTPLHPLRPMDNYTVNLFGAYNNFNASNFGNASNVSITYVSNNPAVPFTYGQLLGTTFNNPFSVGGIYIQGSTLHQVSRKLSLLRVPGVGKFGGESIFPLVYPDQFIPNVTYVSTNFKVDGFVSMSYSQNAVTDPNIKMYFYPSETIDLGRAFSNRRILTEYNVVPQLLSKVFMVGGLHQ